MFISKDSYAKMRLIRKYNMGGAVHGDPKDSKASFLDRARRITNRPLDKFSQMDLGLDFNRVNEMSDEEIGQLFDLIGSLAPEQKGDTEGVVGNITSNLGNIKDTLQGLTENYGVNVEDMLDGVIDHNDMGWLKGGAIKTAAKVAGLYSGGGVIKLLAK
tara:strand:+ start:286 stop:762 length:477 start_codon:yes stop_codon:yes gene_type:complete